MLKKDNLFQNVEENTSLKMHSNNKHFHFKISIKLKFRIKDDWNNFKKFFRFNLFVKCIKDKCVNFHKQMALLILCWEKNLTSFGKFNLAVKSSFLIKILHVRAFSSYEMSQFQRLGMIYDECLTKLGFF